MATKPKSELEINREMLADVRQAMRDLIKTGQVVSYDSGGNRSLQFPPLKTLMEAEQRYLDKIAELEAAAKPQVRSRAYYYTPVT